MAPSNASGYVVPNPRIPSTLGTLHILLGALLIVLGLGLIAWEVLSPSFVDWMRRQSASTTAQVKADREAKITALRKREAAEKTAENKEALKAEREALEGEEEFDGDELGMFGARQGPWEKSRFWVKEVSGLALNVLMIVAGGGLLALRPWGRSLSLWVAGLKLARLFALAALAVLVMIPAQVRQVQTTSYRAMVRTNGSVMPGGATSYATMMAQTTAVTYSLWAVSFCLLGSAYPALTLWLLNKRSVRAALIAASVPPEKKAPDPDSS